MISKLKSCFVIFLLIAFILSFKNTHWDMSHNNILLSVMNLNIFHYLYQLPFGSKMRKVYNYSYIIFCPQATSIFLSGVNTYVCLYFLYLKWAKSSNAKNSRKRILDYFAYLIRLFCIQMNTFWFSSLIFLP